MRREPCESFRFSIEIPSEWPATRRLARISPGKSLALGGHPKPANEGHLKTGQRKSGRTLSTTEGVPSVDVSNVLSEEKQQQVIALGRLGWSLRRIQKETGVRRETAGGLPEGGRRRRSGRRERGAGGHRQNRPTRCPPTLPTPTGQNRPTRCPPTPAPVPLPGRSPTASACEPYLDFIEALARARAATPRPSGRTWSTTTASRGRYAERQALRPPAARRSRHVKPAP